MPLIQWIMQNLAAESPACLHVDEVESVEIGISAAPETAIVPVATPNALIIPTSAPEMTITELLEPEISIAVTVEICRNMANNIGDDMRVQGTWTDASGNLIDPTAVQALVRSPSGIVSTYTWPSSITRVSQGVFFALVPVDEAGVWLGRFISLGTGKAAEPFQFLVDPDAF